MRYSKIKRGDIFTQCPVLLLNIGFSSNIHTFNWTICLMKMVVSIRALPKDQHHIYVNEMVFVIYI